VPSTSVSMTPNRTYQPVFSKLWRISGLEKMAVKLPNPAKWFGGVSASMCMNASIVVSTVGLQRESQDEDEQRCDMA